MPIAQKYPLVKSLNQFASDKIATAGDVLGKSAPATVDAIDPSGTIVTVSIAIQSLFTIPKVRCPVALPPYSRWPLQVGQPGVVFAADYYMGGVSGLGGGQADLTPQSNLGTLVFLPIGNTKDEPTDDKDAVVMYGQDKKGVVLRSGNKKCKMTLDEKGVVIQINDKTVLTLTEDSFVVTVGGQSVNIGTGSIGIGPNTTIDGRVFLTHEHQDVQTGSNDTGPVV